MLILGFLSLSKESDATFLQELRATQWILTIWLFCFISLKTEKRSVFVSPNASDQCCWTGCKSGSETSESTVRLHLILSD